MTVWINLFNQYGNVQIKSCRSLYLPGISRGVAVPEGAVGAVIMLVVELPLISYNTEMQTETETLFKSPFLFRRDFSTYRKPRSTPVLEEQLSGVYLALTFWARFLLSLLLHYNHHYKSNILFDSASPPPLVEEDREETEQSALTALQEALGLLQDGLGQLTGAFEVVEDEDVWSKQHHVLLPTAVWHGQQLVQILKGPAHQVTCERGAKKGRKKSDM